MRQLYTDYNKCVSENIKLKELNQRLLNQKKTLQDKIDISIQKIQNKTYKISDLNMTVTNPL